MIIIIIIIIIIHTANLWRQILPVARQHIRKSSIVFAMRIPRSRTRCAVGVNKASANHSQLGVDGYVDHIYVRCESVRYIQIRI